MLIQMFVLEACQFFCCQSLVQTETFYRDEFGLHTQNQITNSTISAYQARLNSVTCPGEFQYDTPMPPGGRLEHYPPDSVH